MPNLTVRAVGMTFRKNRSYLETIYIGMPVTIVPEPDNKYDPNALKIILGERNDDELHVAYIPRAIAERLRVEHVAHGTITNLRFPPSTATDKKYPAPAGFDVTLTSGFVVDNPKPGTNWVPPVESDYHYGSWDY